MSLPNDTTVLCGAGVSQASGLPDGQALARLAFDLIWARSRVFPFAALDAVHEALRWPANGEPQLRLELILDLMAKEVPSGVLASAYSVVLDAAPCLAHYVLAMAGFPIITTNQDELIEDAARQMGCKVDVLHLHGLASRPESIVTMLSQYSAGLASDTVAALQARLTGRRLLVLGYSGRDLDVMPYLYAADHVTWLHFQSPAMSSPPAIEVRALQAAKGSHMRLITHPNPAQWFLDRLSPSVSHAATTAMRGSLSRTRHLGALSADAQAAFARLALVQRRLAIARVLLHLGEADAAKAGLLRAVRSHPRDPRIQAQIADTLVALQQRPAALRHFARVVTLAADPALRASALLGSAHTRANGADYGRALRDLDQARQFAQAVRDVHERRQLQAWITALQARICGMTDNEAAGIRLYRRVEAVARMERHMDLQVTAMIFASDLLRSRGRYHEALTKQAQVFDDNELFGRPYTRVWGRFYRGETLCATGRLAEGIKDLEECRAAAQIYYNLHAVAWASLVLASYRRCTDLRGAQQAINDCEGAIGSYGKGMLLCEVRLDWERAELARAHGKDDEALRRVDALRKRLAKPSFPVELPYMAAHILALEAEVARGRGDAASRALLAEARDCYARGHWQHHVARMDVSLWLLTGRNRPSAALLQRCRDRGYAAEVGRLTAPGPPYYPLHAL